MINGKDQEIITINKTGNSILNNAKYSADNTDEWYTTYETIAEELSHYKNQFIDKVVLCNCDDPFESNFCYYFLRHFNQLKLKKLICTSYSGSKIDQLVNGQLTLDLLDADGNPVINNKHGSVFHRKFFNLQRMKGNSLSKGLQMLQGIFVKVIMLIMSRSIGYILKYHIIGN